MLYLFVLTLIMIAAGVFFGYKVHGISKVQSIENKQKYELLIVEAKTLMRSGNYELAEVKLESAVSIFRTAEALRELEIVQEITKKAKVEEGVMNQKAHASEILNEKIAHSKKMATLYIESEDYESANKELLFIAENEDSEEINEQLEHVSKMLLTKTQSVKSEQ